MLILTRFPGEKLLIDKGITVTVLGVIGKQVRIGIDAPKNVAVLREEVHLRNLANAEAAADKPKLTTVK